MKKKPKTIWSDTTFLLLQRFSQLAQLIHISQTEELKAVIKDTEKQLAIAVHNELEQP